MIICYAAIKYYTEHGNILIYLFHYEHIQNKMGSYYLYSFANGFCHVRGHKHFPIPLNIYLEPEFL